MIQLLEFQQKAAATLVERFTRYVNDPVMGGTQHNLRSVPFFQALSSITASGKTVILADAISSIGTTLPTPPVVLWLSKGRVVVQQSLANLLPSGKYNHLLGPAEVRPLADYDRDDVADITKPIVYFATVGTFNQRDKENGSLVIYRCDIDTTDQSIWNALQERLTRDGLRRPLIIVYDEAHNLSDQQTDLLMELEPTAFLLASATMRLPQRIAREVDALKASGEWTDETLVTRVDALSVAESGLIKNQVVLAGYQSPMEEAVAALIADFTEAERDALTYGLSGLPKAIYVCNTNIVAGNAAQQDDPKRPFVSRQAPPILIWRQLVEVHGIDPDEVAVYCSLRMDRDYPAPEQFHLFSGGDSDYDDFTSGAFRHVIFNLSLQEGWDDPLCYFAYIDKSMESPVRVEQVIGRLLRQPGARHYAASRLNTAHFYVRVDRGQVFSEILDSVGRSLNTQAPGLDVIVSLPGRARPIEYAPKQVASVPETALDPSAAVSPVSELIRQLTDYRDDNGTNTTGAGSRTIVQRRVGSRSSSEARWETFEQSSRMLARWVFQREVRRRYSGALGVAPTSDPKFDAEVGLGSNAEAHILSVADSVVDTFLDHSKIIQKARDPYRVGPILAREENVVAFKNAIHAGYDDLNTFERAFAGALDGLGAPWCRNPSRSGYRIPLPTLGATSNFFPDFLVWLDEDVFLIDTKGAHLMLEAATRKLLWVEPPTTGRQRLFVKLISEGKWRASDVSLVTNEGFTLWGIEPAMGRTARHFDGLAELVTIALTARDV